MIRWGKSPPRYPKSGSPAGMINRNSAPPPGAGLGLFIVKGLVEAHGGTITVQRAPGGGAEFRFIMPAGLPDFG